MNRSSLIVCCLCLLSGAPTQVKALESANSPGKPATPEHEAIIKIVSPTGRNLEGLPWELRTHMDDGDWNTTPILTGTLGPDTTIRASHLKFEAGRIYEIYAADGALQCMFQPKPGDAALSATRVLSPQPGEVAPDLALVDVMTSHATSLRAYRGKVVLIDFWAKWCGGCQAPMTHLNELANKRGAEWRDKVALLSISCDDDVTTARKHIEQKGWASPWLHHLWFGPGEWAARGGAYGVTGIPTTILIGADGRIIQRITGEDLIQKTNLEQQIDRALGAAQ